MTLNLDAPFLERRDANFRPLTPLNFLFRSADVFPDRAAIVYGNTRLTWRDYARRCLRLASALRRAGIEKGDVVAVLAPNIPAVLEAHFGVPLAGAVINTINIRLDAAAVAFILEHAEAKVLLVDPQWSEIAREALALLPSRPLVVDIEDDQAEGGARVGDLTYEELLATGSEDDEAVWPQDEFETLSLNYTSGTTGNPKGALYHHRGAYLNALGQVLHHKMDADSVYLWTLPMFHCNGWCFTWAVAAVGGTHVCLRKMVAEQVFDLIEATGVTHFCGAPTVLGMLVEGAERSGRRLSAPVAVMTAGSAPPAPVLKAAEDLGFVVRHVYGTTEMHGVVSLCDWHREWDELPGAERSRMMARQGVRTVVTDEMMVADPVTLEPVPRTGEVMGEVMFRGNMGMKGYLKNPSATEAAFAGGWYRTGDLAVVHPNGYIDIKDRSKDIIISGGENISSIEVEEVLYQHPAVASVAVIAMKHDHWGERPCAFVELKAEGTLTTEELLDFCRGRLAKFKVPDRVIFGPIERTATGKVQKFKLRNLIQGQ
ncbi:AMP-binding protein [Xanthobacter pseudotagetidis]|uniref:AMP-binding protein n=1 Tax=Xanthobacter pseudotagetidis TaxID=3119911 RepID=UPI00372BFA62